MGYQWNTAARYMVLRLMAYAQNASRDLSHTGSNIAFTLLECQLYCMNGRIYWMNGRVG